MKLEVGKKYIRRDGSVVEIIECDPNYRFPFKDDTLVWHTKDGRWSDGPDHEWDIIRELESPTIDPVNHPPHYKSHPSGVECITVTEHMGFNLGNAVKYIWRADLKNDAIEDLKKAAWYIAREISKRERAHEST